MITETAKKTHTERLIETTPPERLRVLLMLARKHGYWGHVDWERIAEHVSADEQGMQHGK
jgi:hypothetical protein